MERESFEDQEVAGILNRSFIAIKVDREERPDIDHMFMTYCQAMTGSGGWPLTALLTPDKKPFFTGTYYPKHSNYGRPGLIDILTQVEQVWHKEREKVIQTASELYETIADQYNEKKKGTRQNEEGLNLNTQEEEGVYAWGKGVIRKCYVSMESRFDSEYGGFGDAPKFPSPHNLGFLLRYSLERPQSKALNMVKRTLNSMADGGIWDHVGFGFARYSTDRHWLVPHFEKMLYDNAGLAFIYLEAYQLLKIERYAQVARDIFKYILRDMTSPEGGFYSAEDADSEGVEGKYYVWSKEEVITTLQKELKSIRDGRNQSLIPSKETVVAQFLLKDEMLGEVYCEAYGISDNGNYEGKNIPNRISSNMNEIAFRNNITVNELEQLFSICNRLLLEAREKRIRPAKDDKILVAWNGLMIAALAKGVQVFSDLSTVEEERKGLLLAAEKAVSFISAHMFDSTGRLLARYREGEASYPGYLDDYAFFIYGLLELYTACGKAEYLKLAVKLQEDQERLFHDETNGGYYFTGNDAEQLLLRPKEIYDGAIPSGNSLSLFNLARLWKMTGPQKYQELAEKQCGFLKNTVQDYPPGYTASLQGIQFYLSKSDELVLSGSLAAEALEMQSVIFGDFRPFAVVTYNEGSLEELIPRMKDYPVSEKVSAYLCRDFACREPVDSPEQLKNLLSM